MKREKDEPKKKAAVLQRIDKLQEIMDKTKDQEKQLDLGYEIQRSRYELDNMRSDRLGILVKIESVRNTFEKELGKVRLEKECMEDWCAQAVLEVLDSGPAVPLYVISQPTKEDRDEMIIERLPLDNDRKVRAYQNAKLEGKESEAKKQLCAISHDIVTTSLELVEGSLPDFSKSSPNRIQFLDRTAKVTKAVTGAAPDRDVLKRP